MSVRPRTSEQDCFREENYLRALDELGVSVRWWCVNRSDQLCRLLRNHDLYRTRFQFAKKWYGAGLPPVKRFGRLRRCSFASRVIPSSLRGWGNWKVSVFIDFKKRGKGRGGPRLVWRSGYLGMLTFTVDGLDRCRNRLRWARALLCHLYIILTLCKMTGTGAAVVLKFILRAGPAG